jgi:hypothetical protein
MNIAEERVAFFHEIGLAVTQWAEVEAMMFHVTAVAMRNLLDADLLSYGFFSVENFRSKLEFSNKIILKRFEDNQSHIDSWIDLCKRIDACSSRRNHLAHFSVLIYDKNCDGRRYALVPRFTPLAQQHSSTLKPPSGSLCLRDINAIRLESLAITRTLQNFYARLCGNSELFPKAHEQPENPSPSHTIIAQIHEALGHHAKPSRRKS